MKTTALTVIAVLTTLGGAARAEGRTAEQPKAESQATGPVNSDALEIGAALGASAGFGDVADGRPSLNDTGVTGPSYELDVGYRFSPQFMLGVYGTGSNFFKSDSLPDGATIFSASAGIHANWHFIPQGDFDPWVGLGTGGRGYWISYDQGTTSRLGLDIVRAQAGFDYRVEPHFTLSPLLGASVSTLLREKLVGQQDFQNIASPNVNTYVFAGIMGRFDIGLSSSSRNAVASK